MLSFIFIDYVLLLASEMHWINQEGYIVGLTAPIKIVTEEYLH